jgi:hypothetical protein
VNTQKAGRATRKRPGYLNGILLEFAWTVNAIQQKNTGKTPFVMTIKTIPFIGIICRPMGTSGAL